MKKEVKKIMLKEIGSNFWLNTKSIETNMNIKKELRDFLNIEMLDYAYISTGRSSIAYVLKNLEKNKKDKKALLPSFTCDTVIEPFIEANYEIEYYQIKKNLISSEEDMLAEIKRFKPTVILLHGYFGFNTLGPLKSMILELKKTNDITVIEDITQTMYSNFDYLEADYYIGSLRKWMPLPDGGIVISSENLLSNKPHKTDKNLVQYKLKAFQEKYYYIEKDIGKKSDFLNSYMRAEEILDEQSSIFSMSEISKNILAEYDLENLIMKRRENFNTLSELLKSVKAITRIFDYTANEITPLYFPIYVESDREKLQVYLAERNIFAPIIWPRPKQIEKTMLNKEVEWIYNHILAIPCDQRYTIEEMNYVAQVIKEFYLKKD